MLDIKDLVKTFDGVHALNGASFKIIPHKINLLIGANGSGKTTLINTVSGFYSANGGSVTYHGDDITRNTLDQNFKKGIIRTFQNPRLFENLSVLENLMMVDGRGDQFRRTLLQSSWKSIETSIRKKALSILESLELLQHKNNLAYDMSGGQLKLLEIGKAMMYDAADLVLLDEPIAGVNPTLAHKIFSRISDITKSRKTTFLIIEHRLDIALQYADYVFVMDTGKIIAQDIPQDILKNKKVQESYLGK